MIPLLERLAVHAKTLNALLSDPQPGLLSWSEAVMENWKAIADLWSPGAPDL